MSRAADGSFAVNCTICKTPLTVHPPEPEYVKLIQKPCPRGDSRIIIRTCPACDTQNTIILDTEHD